jgi:phage shock protein A
MGILDRIATVIKANINDLLDSAEDPEKMLDQYIRDMEAGVREAREEVVEAMANEKSLAARAEEMERQAQEWESKAEVAVRAGDDDLARAALRRSEMVTAQTEAAKQSWAAQKERVTALQAQLKALEDKLANTKQRRDALLARYQATRAEGKVAATGAGLGKADKALAEFERMDERIKMEADKAAARAELAAASLDAATASFDRLAKMADEQHIEDRLAALKAKVSGEKGAA